MRRFPPANLCLAVLVALALASPFVVSQVKCTGSDDGGRGDPEMSLQKIRDNVAVVEDIVVESREAPYNDCDICNIWSKVRSLFTGMVDQDMTLVDYKRDSAGRGDVSAQEEGDNDDDDYAFDEGDEWAFDMEEGLEVDGELAGQMRDSLRQGREVPHSIYDITLQDIETATALSFKYLVSPSSLMASAECRDDFLRWEAWIAQSHPSSKCRLGAWQIMAFVQDQWPNTTRSGQDADPKFFRQLANKLLRIKQCSPDVKAKEDRFVHCEGYTCGLWETFHAMSVRTTKEMTGEHMMAAMRGFVDKFFSCQVCRLHFLEVLAEDAALEVRTQQEFALWLWQAHNIVNMRLGEEERDAGSEVKGRPKLVFPLPQKCESCYLRTNPPEFSKGGLVNFLRNRYRDRLREDAPDAGDAKEEL